MRIAMLVARYLESGVLDGSFGDGGIVVRKHGPRVSAQGVAVDPSGRVIVCGFGKRLDNLDRDALILARFLETGQPDPEFGDEGVVQHNQLGSRDQTGHALAIDDLRRVLVASTNISTLVSLSITGRVVRFQEDGELDDSVGINAAGDGSDSLSSVAVSSNGHVYVVGTHASSRCLVASLRPTITGIGLRGDFGDEGVTTVSFGDGTASFAEGVALQPMKSGCFFPRWVHLFYEWFQGRGPFPSPSYEDDIPAYVVLCASVKQYNDPISEGPYKIGVAALKTDGSPSSEDFPSYPGDLPLIIEPPGNASERAEGIVYRKSIDGFLVLGTAIETGKPPTVVIYRASTILANSFARVQGAYGRAIALDSRDRVIVAGHTDDGQLAVMRLTADGELDLTFGGSGIVHTSISGGAAVGRAVTVDDDDRVIVAGWREEDAT